jgi:hypothetical protein
LYTPDATISRDTLVYTSSGEVSSTGYTAGGKTLTNFTFALTDEEHGIEVMIHGDDVEWTGVSFTTLYGLVYNSSNVNRVLAFLRFDQVPVHLSDLIVSNGSFKVILE